MSLASPHTKPIVSPQQRKQAIFDKALQLGFDAVGIANASEPLTVDFERYKEFVDRGFHGGLGWLADPLVTRERLDTDAILEGAQSVICLAKSYHRSDHPPSGSLATHIAKYARGRDYHTWLRDRVRRVAQFVRDLGDGIQARPMVGTAPILERAWAAKSGLGFIGKNGMVITPGVGSYTLLAEVVTTLSLPPDERVEQRCGSCTRCLDVCPTQAFVAPFVLDARRCISYMTIEQRTPIAEEFRPHLGPRVFGCDACQEICPFNRTAPPENRTTEAFRPHTFWTNQSISDVLALATTPMDQMTDSTPLRRTGDLGLLRHSILAAANGRLTACIPMITKLCHHGDPMVHEYAVWALQQLTKDSPA